MDNELQEKQILSELSETDVLLLRDAKYCEKSQQFSPEITKSKHLSLSPLHAEVKRLYPLSAAIADETGGEHVRLFSLTDCHMGVF